MELEDIQHIVAKQQAAPVPSIEQRIDLLRRLKSMLIDHEQAWLEALQEDLGKPMFEAFTTEIAVLLNEIDHVIRQLPSWSKSRSSRHLKLGYIERIRKTREPYGSVLIISPWNYPLQLALMPAINAIAAGNRCVIKPSEYTPSTGRLLETMMNQYVDHDLIAIVNGGAKLAKQLTSMSFDCIFFTGSGEVGKAVLRQAANQLTPVLLELGGKNPCLIDETGFSKAALQHIVWGKFLNAGQTCIAPDTLFVHASVYEQVLREIPSILKAYYGVDASCSQDYGRIGHPAHYRKLCGYLSQGKVWHGGQASEKDLYIEPTVLINLEPGAAIWQEEIFGPILPVVPYSSFEQVVAEGWLQRDALVAYLFSRSKSNQARLQEYVKSTVLSVNQVLHHATHPAISFGGIGSSGLGAYHGKAGFDSFSYEQATYEAKHYLPISKKFPPYAEKDRLLLKKWRKWLL